VFALVLSAHTTCAQSDSTSSDSAPDELRWYFSFGVSAYSDYLSGKTTRVPVYDSIHEFKSGYFKPHHYSGFNLLTFTYSIRYNIVRFNDDHSLSLNMPVALGLNSLLCDDGSRGFLSLSAPLMLEFNSGAASNFSTLKWKGWMVGIGAEFNVFPLISSEQYSYRDASLSQQTLKAGHEWIQPAAEVAYRWINTDQDAREINLKIGYGLPDKVTEVDRISRFQPFSAKLTYLFFINY
jgi:hypothetical protein